ncbi:MAG: RAD55 family ATPase [Nanoarchaeota archaeon]
MTEKNNNYGPDHEFISERARTDIPGFDSLINGGFPRNFNILLTGGPGTGKSIFGMQYLFNGATKNGETGLFVSFEQTSEKLKKQANQFGWNMHALEETGEVHIMNIPAVRINKKTITKIKNYIEDNNIKRIVIDSLSALVINAPIYNTLAGLNSIDKSSGKTYSAPPIVGEHIINRFLYSFIDELEQVDATKLLIAESSNSGKTNDEVTLGEYVCDGVITLSFENHGQEFSRSITIKKMRETKNDDSAHPVEIGKHGIVIHKQR